MIRLSNILYTHDRSLGTTPRPRVPKRLPPPPAPPGGHRPLAGREGEVRVPDGEAAAVADGEPADLEQGLSHVGDRLACICHAYLGGVRPHAVVRRRGSGRSPHPPPRGVKPTRAAEGGGI